VAFAGLPFLAEGGVGVGTFLAVIVVWAATSSALRAPPLMLLGKYAARPAIPYLAGLAILGVGIAGAVSPYLAMLLTKRDPRLPFVIASIALVLTSLALAKVERTLAKSARPSSKPALQTNDRAVALPVLIFTLASLVFAFGFQTHFFFNSAPIFKHFSSDVRKLMPLFWIGFSIGMLPATRIAKRYGGLLSMGLAGLTGAVAIVLMENTTALELVVAAQFIAGAAWGCILMSAIAAAAALGYSGAEGKTTGLLFSALALATFTRMGVTATGALNNPTFAPVWHWAPPACWAIAGAALVGLSVARRPNSLGGRCLHPK